MSVVEDHSMISHVYMYLSVPSKSSVSKIVGFMNGKSAILIAMHVGGRQRNFTGKVFW
ncbi:transposase [Undibacterium oligocarboniphilum]|uniref:Transposase n=2 Tax=Oxalobacteraceae TaxID=75682 RepID=A0A850QK72_9BURK|nr:transposase [Undibacterium oligocarboniphilum]MBC3879472.1 transposase [Undibacterium sp. FT79W]NVO79459.1 transposase [Undibacterium oligocarboniphilum]